MEMRTLIFISIGMVLISCKKDKLKDEKEILIGKWEWVYSIEDSSICDPPFTTGVPNDTLTPISENITYSIEFQKKGKFSLFKNGQEILNDIIQFGQWVPTDECYCSITPAYSFIIGQEQFITTGMSGFVGIDSMNLASFPFPYESEEGFTACEHFENYFVRVE